MSKWKQEEIQQIQVYPNEKFATSIKKCRELDTKIRKIMEAQGIKSKTLSNSRIYLRKTKGGLGLRPLELEAELQIVRRGIYLTNHPKLADTLERYEALQRAGWRNPISDMDYVLQKYEIPCPDPMEDFKKAAAKITFAIKGKYEYSDLNISLCKYLTDN